MCDSASLGRLLLLQEVYTRAATLLDSMSTLPVFESTANSTPLGRVPFTMRFLGTKSPGEQLPPQRSKATAALGPRSDLFGARQGYLLVTASDLKFMPAYYTV